MRASYDAYMHGREPNGPSARSSPSEPDELEVLGGRHAVITTKSSPNSPSQMTASPPNIHREANMNSSPISRHAGPSNGYYAMDPSPNLLSKSHEYHHMEDAMDRFEDHSYSSIGKAPHTPRVAHTAYAANYATMGTSSDVRLAQPMRDQAVNGHYGMQNDPYSQPTSTHQPSPPYLPYVHGHNPGVQGAHPESPYEYPPRQLQELTTQNQDEIWRSFMMGYGP
ncbi:hypothetical protein C0991_008123 [Blastosporella zonata]|nr:hypothetical protein C0991_008123 [Blastosporella zonata]